MQRRLAAREINPDVLINIPSPHFSAKKRRACEFYFLFFFFWGYSYMSVCVCVRVYRVPMNTQEALIKKKKCANKHASHITREPPLAWLLIKPAAPIRDYKD